MDMGIMASLGYDGEGMTAIELEVISWKKRKFHRPSSDACPDISAIWESLRMMAWSGYRPRT